ncbi:MAG: SiaB family protein kinase [Bacteroidales bacterium]|nr:SiaB family protein kinase [Bacteroidales bacterium]
MDLDINRLYVRTCGADVLFAFEGEISSERINLILEEIEAKTESMRIELRLRKKIYNVMVECLQNLYHHSDEVPLIVADRLGKSYGMVVLKREGNTFMLTVGNFVSTDKVKFLSEKIEKLNSLSKDELKEMYKFILNYQKLSPKGGGGLGLIDIARKSGHKLSYQFYGFDDMYSFYRLDIVI